MPVSLLLAIVVAGTDAHRAPPPRSAEPLYPRIDVLIAGGHEGYAKEAVPLADDAEFVRRVYLDLTGTIPTAAATRAFLDDKTPNKRARLIDTSAG